MTMQPSLTTMKTVTACDEALHLRDFERKQARVVRERRRGSKVRGKKVKVLRFLRPSRFRRLLACSLATRNGEGAPSPKQFLVVVGVRYSVSQFTLGIPRKNSSYLQTKQRPLLLHVSFSAHFNQPLTINNIAALTNA